MSRSATDTSHLDFLVPRKANLRPDEMARIFDCDPKSVARYFEAREFLGIELNKGKGQLMTRRFPRPWVLLALAQKANGTAEDITDRLTEVLASLSREQLAQVHATAGRMLAKL